VSQFIIFNVQCTMYCIVFGLAAAWYVQPRLRLLDQNSALVVPLLVSALRVNGLLFLVPSLNLNMPDDFAIVAALGDTAVAVLALVGALANRAKSSLGVPLAWAYAIIGGGDLAYGFLQGFRYEMFSHLGGDWFPIILTAALVIVALVTLFVLLLRPNPAAAAKARA
jgi:hypothetical protein